MADDFLYQNNLECDYRLRAPNGLPLSLQFVDFHMDESDSVQFYDGTNSNSVQLHLAEGFHGKTATFSAHSGQLLIRFKSDALKSERGWRTVFSADCPALSVGETVISSSNRIAS